MINVHKRLIEAFGTMPNIGVTDTSEGFAARYEWGDFKHLNQLIKLDGNNPQKPVYPIIYNISNSATHEFKRNAATIDASFVIATRNTNVDMVNSQRWAASYNNVLFPLVGYMVQLFTKSQIFAWNGEFNLFEFPNYGQTEQKESNATTDIWDALRLDTTITINDKCLKTIKYT